MRKVSAMIFLALSMLVVGAYAQNITGSIAGRVLDQQGASGPDATVTVTDLAKKITVNTKTSSEGRKR
jgi:hypothetical protein